jgi:hypothetical protein
MRIILLFVALTLAHVTHSYGSEASQAGKSTIAPIRNVYSVTNVTTLAWVQLAAAIQSGVSEVEIFDSSGQTLQLGVGAAGHESVILTVLPGGNGRVPLKLDVGSRLSIKALTATANSGEIDINLYQ